VLIFVASLRIVNIPLTALAFVGGAVAIGVGFGSQNVVSNFISGVILLAERPIKLGDLVEVGGVYGSVERIGLRSTRIRTGDNIHVIVPNASFLESNVVNWTHTDERVRVSVEVGVAYGSATREVERVIREALAEHPRVEKSPDPVVLFTKFGDNSLEFRALFWIRMRRQLDRPSVESELRFRIDDLFREAGIVIAFPQRDVHLDAASPFEVRLVRSGPEAG
jgi:potassium efflux system protein